MSKKIWKHVSFAFLVVTLAATVAAGSAEAGKRGVGKSVDGSEVVNESLTGADVKDGSLTGADIDESSLTCTGPNGIPGCGGTGTPPASPTITLGTPATAQIGYPAVKTGLATSPCPAGTKVISGSVSFDNDKDEDDVFIRESGITGPNSWYALAVSRVNTNNPVTLRVTAICIS